jgi:lycopene cyclase domain-containing protein
MVAAAVVVGVEVLWLRTGLLRRPAYAVTMLIMFVGQVVVDGWLTKLSAPIVLYDEERTTGVRFPWDIPIEDFLFGFALLTLVLLLWERAGAKAR